METDCPRCGHTTKTIDRERIGKLTIAGATVWFVSSKVLAFAGYPLPFILEADWIGFSIISGAGAINLKAKPRFKIWCSKCKYFADAEEFESK